MFKPTSLVTTLTAAALAVAVAVTAAAAQTPPAAQSPPAQPAAPSAPAQQRAAPQGPILLLGPGMWGAAAYGRMCDPRAAGLAGWRADQIVRAIKPNEMQKAGLEKLREVSAKAAEIITAACPNDLPLTSTGRLELMEKRMAAMLQAITTVRPIFDAFYATLDDEQKARLDSVGPGRGQGERGERRRHRRWHWR